MRLDTQNLDRLTIYYFFDKDGIIDNYILTMLNAIKLFSSELIIVGNGLLTPDNRRKLEGISSDLFVCDNFGFKAFAFKDTLERIGIEKLTKFDEILLITNDFFGPLYPLTEMFSEMNNRELDFWGVTSSNDVESGSNGFEKTTSSPKFLQTNFLAIRKRMFSSPEFWNFWKNLPTILNSEEIDHKYTAFFTRYFEEKGFKWQEYINIQDYSEGSNTPHILSPLFLIQNCRCPILEKECFQMDYLDFLRSTNGESTLQVFEFIQKNLLYDVNLIWDNLLRTMNLADLHNVMHLTYILPSSISNPNYLNKKKIALLIHIFFEDLIDECYAYAQSIPEQSDVYITTNNEEKKEEILKKFKNLKCNNLFVSVIDNRGRDINALLIAPKQFIMDYDYVCFVHSKKSSHMAAITGASWRYKCFENLLKSRQFVENVISTFEENPRLGILVPPHPSHGDYYSTLGVGEWLGNYKNVSELAKILDIHVDIDPEKEPIAPLGSMFWFRPSALKALYNYDWKVSDFPEGNMATDGTLSHAIERIHPFVAQQAGYYSAYIMSDHYARIEDTNLYYMLRKLNKTLFNIYGLNSYYGLLNTIEHFSKKSQNSKKSRFSRFIRKFINIFESTISICRY